MASENRQSSTCINSYFFHFKYPIQCIHIHIFKSNYKPGEYAWVPYFTIAYKNLEFKFKERKKEKEAWVYWASWFYRLLAFIKFGEFLAIISSNSSPPFTLFSPYGTLITHTCMLDSVFQVSEVLFIFPSIHLQLHGFSSFFLPTWLVCCNCQVDFSF